jgi:hypothetical protein
LDTYIAFAIEFLSGKEGLISGGILFYYLRAGKTTEATQQQKQGSFQPIIHTTSIENVFRK